MNQRKNSNGIGLGMLLFIIFLILKLTHAIDWSWWWITAPLWIPLAILVAILAVAGAIVVFAYEKPKGR